MSDLVYPDDSRTWGTDVSVYDDDNETLRGVDYVQMKKQGAQFVFVRAGQGPWVDEDWQVNWAAAKAAGLLRGAYWYLDARYSATEQGLLFRSLLLNDPGEFRPAMDYECDLKRVVADRRGRTTSETVYNDISQADDFLNSLAWPVPAAIYTGFYYWKDHGSTDIKWAVHPLWIAGYGAEKPMIPMPWKTWMFWQFTDRGPGRVLGAESNGLDLSYFNGTPDDLAKYAGHTVDIPPSTDPSRLVLSGSVSAAWTDATGVGHVVTGHIVSE